LFLCGDAIEILKIIRPGFEKTGKDARVKVRARGGIDIDKLRPAKITLVFRADQSGDVAGMPAQCEHYANKLPDVRRPQKKIVWVFQRDADAGG
jgi:hypothetical protein